MNLNQPNPEPGHVRKWTVMAAVAMGIFLATIDGSIVNVALPTLVRSFPLEDFAPSEPTCRFARQTKSDDTAYVPP
jgi:hypothetical protein